MATTKPKTTDPKKPLTKTQILTQIAEATELAKKDIEKVLYALNDLAYKETKKKGRFSVLGFGILKLQKRKARIGRNPATGESIKIPAKTVVKFSLSKVCKDQIIPPKK